MFDGEYMNLDSITWEVSMTKITYMDKMRYIDVVMVLSTLDIIDKDDRRNFYKYMYFNG